MTSISGVEEVNEIGLVREDHKVRQPCGVLALGDQVPYCIVSWADN